jgi:PAS domain S-box-containing protein/putative nucleotidyltransferase with HDIG domain
MNGSSVDKPKKRHHPGTAPANRDQQIKRTAGLLTMAHAEIDQIFETAADGMCVIDKKYNTLRVNKTFAALFGVNRNEVIGKKCYEEFPGPSCRTDGCPMERIFKGVERLEYEVEKPHQDGTRIPCILTATPLRGPGGNLIGIVEDFRDIRDLKGIQNELRLSCEKLQKTLEGVIQAVAMIVETRDPYTAGHQKRVTALACAIAAELGITDDKITGIRTAAMVHDVGKIHVPTEILYRSAKLNKKQSALMEDHPQIGYEILKDIEFPWPVAQAVLQHHERIDGSGYPQGLPGKDIILEARIIGVADVVESMASFRPYRPALGINMALEEISKNRGICYDFQVVDACLSLFAKGIFDFEKNK